MPQNTAAFPQPLSCVYRASTYMTCGSVYALPCLALPCFGFELVTIIACARTQQLMHPQQQTAAAPQLSPTREICSRARVHCYY